MTLEISVGGNVGGDVVAGDKKVVHGDNITVAGGSVPEWYLKGVRALENSGLPDQQQQIVNENWEAIKTEVDKLEQDEAPDEGAIVSALDRIKGAGKFVKGKRWEFFELAVGVLAPIPGLAKSGSLLGRYLEQQVFTPQETDKQETGNDSSNSS